MAVRTGVSKTEKSDPELKIWNRYGTDAVYFQREAQVNFWTVLGGLAMGALLTQLGPLLHELQTGRWYLVLYVASSMLVLGISWVQTAWGSLVLKWSISIVATVITLFQMLAQSIQCLLVTNPTGWFVATGCIILFSLIMQFYFEKSGGWHFFSPERIKQFKTNNGIYAGFAVLCSLAALQLYFFPSRLAEAIWSLVVFSLAVLALVMQHQGMKREKLELGIP